MGITNINTFVSRLYAWLSCFLVFSVLETLRRTHTSAQKPSGCLTPCSSGFLAVALPMVSIAFITSLNFLTSSLRCCGNSRHLVKGCISYLSCTFNVNSVHEKTACVSIILSLAKQCHIFLNILTPLKQRKTIVLE